MAKKSEETNENGEVKNVKIDENVKEIINNIGKEVKLTQKELEILEKEGKESVEFLKKIDDIVLKSDNYVIFVDGNEQLVYQDGEFYIETTTDSTKPRKKKKKAEARNMYIEYFMKYQLNYIIRQRSKNDMVKAFSKEKQKDNKQQNITKTKENTKEKTIVKKKNAKEDMTR